MAASADPAAILCPQRPGLQRPEPALPSAPTRCTHRQCEGQNQHKKGCFRGRAAPSSAARGRTAGGRARSPQGALRATPAPRRQGGSEGGEPRPWQRARRREEESSPPAAPSPGEAPGAPAMGEEGAAKLRLKPRAAPPARGPGTPPSRPTSTDRCPWFEKEDLNEREKPWVLLLKDISQDLHCTKWDTVPSLPEFLEKGAEEESPAHQEVFTAGMRDFPWVPFPPFHTEQCLNPKDFSSQSNESHTGWGQADKLPSLSPTAEETCRGTSTDRGKPAAGGGTKGISELGASPEPRQLPGHRSSAQPLAQGSGRASSPRQHHTGAAQSRGGRREKGGKELQPQEGKVPAGQDRAVPVEEPPGSIPGAGSCEEKVENQSGGSSALDSCPMCLMQFSGTLSQLDIDGHLARCLSESADDVMW
ncbi:Fanconi anemia core complex-associated protein 20 [Pseudopipra pipra]|uniref:Fanconi anemia core complex-associated protein 20 n=1 Tax=Pseudopipra pipra TaxID=415032 RepID=UPI00313A08EB